MKKFLHDIGLIENFQLYYNIKKEDFVSLLQNNISKPQSFLSMGFGSKKEYSGSINTSGFELRKTKKAFERERNHTKITGRLIENNNSLLVDVEINGFEGKNGIIIILSCVIFPLLIYSVTNNEETKDNTLLKLFILIMGLMTVGFLYFMTIVQMDKIKKSFMKDLNFIIHNTQIENTSVN